MVDLQAIVNQKVQIISNRLKLKNSETLIQQYFQRTKLYLNKTVVSFFLKYFLVRMKCSKSVSGSGIKKSFHCNSFIVFPGIPPKLFLNNPWRH